MSKSLSTSQVPNPMNTLDTVLAAIPTPVKHMGVVSTEMTNAAILNYAKRYRLTPARKWKDTLYYRVVTMTAKRIFKIDYTTEPPEYLIPLFPADKISLKHASKAYGISESDIKQMFPERMFESKNPRFYLADLNYRVRRYLETRRVP